jgi:hypothetical protein
MPTNMMSGEADPLPTILNDLYKLNVAMVIRHTLFMAQIHVKVILMHCVDKNLYISQLKALLI